MKGHCRNSGDHGSRDLWFRLYRCLNERPLPKQWRQTLAHRVVGRVIASMKGHCRNSGDARMDEKIILDYMPQ